MGPLFRMEVLSMTLLLNIERRPRGLQCLHVLADVHGAIGHGYA